jgi:hypothetical protein
MHIFPCVVVTIKVSVAEFVFIALAPDFYFPEFSSKGDFQPTVFEDV